MNDAVIVTLMICGTICLLEVVSAYNKYHDYRKLQKRLDNFEKQFKLRAPQPTENKYDFFKEF